VKQEEGGKCPACGHNDFADEKVFPNGSYRTCLTCGLGVFDGEQKPCNIRPEIVAVSRLRSWIVTALSFSELWPVLLGPSQTVLEIGSGRGEVLWLLKAFRHSPVAINGSAAQGDRASKIGATSLVGMFPDTTVEPSSVDAIIMRHVFEHMRDPVATLRAAYAALKPGGRVVIVSPNYDAYGREKVPDTWNWVPEAHTFQWGRKSLTQLGCAVGLRARRVRSIFGFNSLPRGMWRATGNPFGLAWWCLVELVMAAKGRGGTLYWEGVK